MQRPPIHPAPATGWGQTAPVAPPPEPEPEVAWDTGTEAAASVTYAVIDPHGLPALVTFRAPSGVALLDLMAQAGATLVGQGYIPDQRGRGGYQAPAQANPPAPVATGSGDGSIKTVKGYRVTEPPMCPVHTTTPMTVKSNRATGEEFWACAQPDPAGGRFCNGPRQLKPGPY